VERFRVVWLEEADKSKSIARISRFTVSHNGPCHVTIHNLRTRAEMTAGYPDLQNLVPSVMPSGCALLTTKPSELTKACLSWRFCTRNMAERRHRTHSPFEDPEYDLDGGGLSLTEPESCTILWLRGTATSSIARFAIQSLHPCLRPHWNTPAVRPKANPHTTS